MEKSFDLCSGRDHRGRQWFTKLPAGVVKTGMFIRLVGGIFILVDRVEQGGQPTGTAPVCTAAQVLSSVWEGRCHV